MIKDAESGGEINDELVAQLTTAKESAESKAIVKTDEEKLFEQVIYPGRNTAIDTICEAL